MKASPIFRRALALLGLVVVNSQGLPAPALPFRVEACEDVSGSFTGAPRLHSFAWAQWEGKWIFLAGRAGGYHGVGQGEVDFPRSRANLKIWVVEPSESGQARVYSRAAPELPA